MQQMKSRVSMDWDSGGKPYDTGGRPPGGGGVNNSYNSYYGDTSYNQMQRSHSADDVLDMSQVCTTYIKKLNHFHVSYVHPFII